MKSRANAEVSSVHPYAGHWSDSDYVIERRLKRADLADPNIKPSFIVHLTNGERILVGWTDKEKQRLFYIKEFLALPSPTSDKWMLKVVRMRGSIWRRTIKAVKKGMTKWFQNESFGGFEKFSFPLFKQVYPQLIASELVSVQPMTSPTNLIFFMKHGQKISL